MSEARIVVAASAGDLGKTAAEMVVESAQGAASPNGMFTIALSGGSTPAALYNALAAPPFRDQVPWDRTQVFFSDERFVPPDSPDSNFYNAQQTLLSRVPVPERFVHRPATVGIDPAESAAIYEEGIRRVLQAPEGQAPAFDLILLGMGDDGHTASLFPGTQALNEVNSLVFPNFVPRLDMWRITFTYPLINAARRVMFLVGGSNKASTVADVLGSADLPAARVQPVGGELVWVLDPEAASQLPNRGEPVA